MDQNVTNSNKVNKTSFNQTLIHMENYINLRTHILFEHEITSHSEKQKALRMPFHYDFKMSTA